MGMEKIVLGPMAGAVDSKKAKIWLYGLKGSDQEVKLCHLYYKENNDPAAAQPFLFQPLANIPYEYQGNSYLPYLAVVDFPDPDAEYLYRVEFKAGDQPWRSEEFFPLVPFPGSGDKDFSFGLISCHKAFHRKKRHEKRLRMWKDLGKRLKEHGGKFLLQVGDQVYCDAKENNAWEKSHHTDSHLERLKYYRDVYFDSWGYKELQAVTSEFPQFMIWDDHEVSDGWGAKAGHFTPENQAIFGVAKMAYIEFQDAHNPDPLIRGEFYYAFQYGNAAFFVLDTRGHRDITRDVLLGEMQWEKFEQWLHSPLVQAAKVLFIISSVPVFHLSRDFWSLGKIVDDAANQWSFKGSDETKGNNIERRQLLKNLFQWSGDENKPVYILGGDVHVGTEVCMAHLERNQVIQQITSSPITNRVAGFLDFLFAFLSKNIDGITDWSGKDVINARIVRRHRKKNFAIIDVKYKNGRPRVFLNMYRNKEETAKTKDRDLEKMSKELFLDGNRD
jgi:alkaline phosphatase D